MNWDRVEGDWKQIKGKVQQQWGKLTDDDLDVIEGKRTELAGRLQERYGYAKDEAEKQIDFLGEEHQLKQLLSTKKAARFNRPRGFCFCARCARKTAPG